MGQGESGSLLPFYSSPLLKLNIFHGKFSASGFKFF